jgi:hypothetical protein
MCFASIQKITSPIFRIIGTLVFFCTGATIRPKLFLFYHCLIKDDWGRESQDKSLASQIKPPTELSNHARKTDPLGELS